MYQYRPRHAVRTKAYHQSRTGRQRPSRSKKFYAWGVLWLLIFGGLAYWLFISANFRLTRVMTSDAKNFATQALIDMAWQTARQPKLLPADNLWLFDKKSLLAAINEKYYLSNLKIKIRLPHTLMISFQEQNYGLIWQEDNHFYYVNYQGDIIFEKFEAAENVALVYNRGHARKEGRRINIEEKYLTFANDLNRAFSEQIKGLTDREIFIDDELNTVKIQITNGPVIKFNTEDPVTKQLLKLETLRRLELSDGKVFNSKQYIDLRYGDRIFYQ